MVNLKKFYFFNLAIFLISLPFFAILVTDPKYSGLGLMGIFGLFFTRELLFSFYKDKFQKEDVTDDKVKTSILRSGLVPLWGFFVLFMIALLFQLNISFGNI